MMGARLDIRAASPDGLAAMLSLTAYSDGCGLDRALLELVRLRVSQIDGCAFCIDMHSAAARRFGVEDQRMHLLPAWRDAQVFSPLDAAALEWAEVLTRLPAGTDCEAVYAQAERIFTTRQLVDLTIAVAEINAWNRIMAAARMPPKNACERVSASCGAT